MPDPVTLVYKTVSAANLSSGDKPFEIPLHLDVYPPANSHLNDYSTPRDEDFRVPAVVYFHGGGLLVGNRKSWFPEWLHGEHRLFHRSTSGH